MSITQTLTTVYLLTNSIVVRVKKFRGLLLIHALVNQIQKIGLWLKRVLRSKNKAQDGEEKVKIQAHKRGHDFPILARKLLWEKGGKGEKYQTSY